MKIQTPHFFRFRYGIMLLFFILTIAPMSAYGQQNSDAQKLGMALEYFTSAKYHEAMLILQDLDKKYELNPRYKAYLGVCYYYGWEYEHAIKYLDEAIPQLENFAPHERSIYYFCNAESHFNIQRYEESMPLYEKMLELCYPNEKADALYRLGFCYMFQQEWLLARDYYRMALKYYKQYLNTPNNSARIAQTRNMIAGCMEHLPQEFNYLPNCQPITSETLQEALQTGRIAHLPHVEAVLEADSIKVSPTNE